MIKLSDNPPVVPDGIESLHDIAGDWWVAHTRARAEKAFAFDLLAHNVPYFLPLAKKTAIWGGRKRTILIPLFPSYVFFCGNADVRYTAFATNRLANVIPVSQRGQFVTELDAIRLAIGEKFEMDLHPFAVIGQRCRITCGKMQGTEGTIIRKDGSTRLVLQVSMLGQGAWIEVPPDYLEPVE